MLQNIAFPVILLNRISDIAHTSIACLNENLDDSK